MFSITTMASSTTNPVEMASAMSERLSTLYPSRYITANVPSNDKGTEILGMTVAHKFLKKMKTTRMTSPMEIRIVYSMSSIEARTVVVRSVITDSWIDGGIEARICGSSSST